MQRTPIVAKKPPKSNQSFGSDEEINISKRFPDIEKTPVVGDERTEWQGAFEWDLEVNVANETLFGNECFRENQREIINATKSGKDVLALIPTGGGKSLTFQLSAVTGQGVTIVIMPLLSLIEDNLNFVLDLGIDACSLSVGNQKNEDKSVGSIYG